MLQQTRVAAVIPYYEKFLAAFPNPKSLAAAPQERVLALWAGLGYYSRARNLQKAARSLAPDFQFPADYESIRALPGVGDYTAAAVASIAFRLPHAAVDGNVRRVLVRLSNDDHADAPSLAARLLDRADPGRWNQALMELGATICTPRDPNCGECPLANFCRARRAGTQSAIPSKRKKRPPERLEKPLLVIEKRGKILFFPGILLAGFWELPGELPGALRGAFLGEFRHTIQHRHYRFRVYQGRLPASPAGSFRMAGRRGRWVAREKLDEIALSTTAKKALRCLKDGYVESHS